MGTGTCGSLSNSKKASVTRQEPPLRMRARKEDGLSDPLDVNLLDLFEVDHAAWFLAHFVPSDAHICFLQKLLPLMAEKLRERQPLLVPGGEYDTLLAEEEKQCEAAPTTSNSQESDFSITDRKMLSCPSMTVDTVSTHVKLEQNDTFPWLWELPRTDRFRYVMLAKALARVRTKEKKQLRASFVQSRTDKAKADEAAHATRAKAAVKTADAETHVWVTEQDMKTALHKGNGEARVETTQKRLLTAQLSAFVLVGVYKKDKAASKCSLEELVTRVKLCMAARAKAAGAAVATTTSSSASTSSAMSSASAVSSASATSSASSTSSASATSSASSSSAGPHDPVPAAPGAEEVADPSVAVTEDADDGDSESDDEEKYQMPCCGQWYLPETVTKIGTLVECVRCLEWYHIRPLGECPGEGITKKLAQTRTYIHVCRICNVKES